MIYLTSHDASAVVKGHIDLNKNVVNIYKEEVSGVYFIKLETKTRVWTFQYDAVQDRDNWFNILKETCSNCIDKQKHRKMLTETFMDEQKRNVDALLLSPTSPSYDAEDFVGVQMTFKVIIHGLCIYEDK